jgi:NhaA family Na+:H+ antiporter
LITRSEDGSRPFADIRTGKNQSTFLLTVLDWVDFKTRSRPVDVTRAHSATPRPRSVLRAFLKSEAAGGIVLMGIAVLALVAANSPLAAIYFAALETHVLGLSVLHWINDALMAVFFLLVGLEIKREILDGQLSTWPRRALPGIAALGGMVVPALIYVALNWGEPETLRGRRH